MDWEWSGLGLGWWALFYSLLVFWFTQLIYLSIFYLFIYLFADLFFHLRMSLICLIIYSLTPSIIYTYITLTQLYIYIFIFFLSSCYQYLWYFNQPFLLYLYHNYFSIHFVLSKLLFNLLYNVFHSLIFW